MQKPLGMLKAALFKNLLALMQKNIAYRDNERHFTDRSTFAIKRGFAEVGRRAVERGYLKQERDFYFLTMDELFEVLKGHANLPLCKAKIASRAKNFDAFDNREVSMPMYVNRGRPVDLDEALVSDSTPGVYRGEPTSRGRAIGRARVVKTLKEIGRIKPGEILITNSTDPGWTPVFMVIKGIVLETGGLLAHGALLAREYGFPAVQLDEACRLIPDGALISLDGDTGIVTLMPEEDEALAPEAAAAK